MPRPTRNLPKYRHYKPKDRAVVLSAAPLARGQGDPPAVGMKVVLKAGTPLMDGGKPVDAGTRFRIYKIADVENGTALITSEGVQGRVPTGRLMSLDAAATDCTRSISRNADRAISYDRRGRIRAELGPIAVDQAKAQGSAR